ncbi:hypothetical protein HDF22_003393 [Mucilaginibacter lappiensis]|uniref:Uncharacterized protein n=1 Tax=Mucilaginibacter lappiensis TaxID=354630 RepID=A0A841JEC6_9SPHI|nr:hypothetical protein [Mucilaginibacter lappiensis]
MNISSIFVHFFQEFIQMFIFIKKVNMIGYTAEIDHTFRGNMAMCSADI